MTTPHIDLSPCVIDFGEIFLFLELSQYLINIKTCFSHFLSMFDANTMIIFKVSLTNSFDQLLTVPEILQLFFSKELLVIYSRFEPGSEHKYSLGAS